MINPVWLKTFCTLCDTGHFTRTADLLHMTQSGVSQQVKKLEQQLSKPLLARDGKSFTLTEAGKVLHRQGQQLLRAAKQLEQDIKQDEPFYGRISIATPGSVGLKLYPFLLNIQLQYPGLTIKHVFAPNKSIERDIAQRVFDLGIMTQPSTTTQVVCKPIASEALVLVTPRSVKQVSWEGLMQLGFISHPDGNYHCQGLLGKNFPQFEHPEQFKRQGFSNQINLILEPVSRGLGFTVLPLFAAKAFHGQSKIRLHRLALPVHQTLYLCHHNQVVLSERVRFVSKQIGMHLADEHQEPLAG